MALTFEQHTVANLRSGIHLVLAPPGTGKTDILSERINRALHIGIRPEKMLCLTFTSRASKEMSSRIAAKQGQTAVFIGNIHTFCLEFLKDKSVINNATILQDEDESKNILNESIKSYIDSQLAANSLNVFDERKYR